MRRWSTRFTARVSASPSRATARWPRRRGIDWLCVSPKAGTDVVQRSGDELKLVWPQDGIDPAELEDWDFEHFLVQPMDCDEREAAFDAAIALAMERPRLAPVAAGAQGRRAALATY